MRTSLQTIISKYYFLLIFSFMIGACGVWGGRPVIIYIPLLQSPSTPHNDSSSSSIVLSDSDSDFTEDGSDEDNEYFNEVGTNDDLGLYSEIEAIINQLEVNISPASLRESIANLWNLYTRLTDDQTDCRLIVLEVLAPYETSACHIDELLELLNNRNTSDQDIEIIHRILHERYPRFRYSIINQNDQASEEMLDSDDILSTDLNNDRISSSLSSSMIDSDYFDDDDASDEISDIIESLETLDRYSEEHRSYIMRLWELYDSLSDDETISILRILEALASYETSARHADELSNFIYNQNANMPVTYEALGIILEKNRVLYDHNEALTWILYGLKETRSSNNDALKKLKEWLFNYFNHNSIYDALNQNFEKNELIELLTIAIQLESNQMRGPHLPANLRAVLQQKVSVNDNNQWLQIIVAVKTTLAIDADVLGIAIHPEWYQTIEDDLFEIAKDKNSSMSEIQRIQVFEDVAAKEKNIFS